MTQVYIIRHAEADGNLYRRMHGHYNSLVTENGYAQIAALGKRFEGVQVDAVYSSDLFRAKTTARSIADPRQLSIITNPDLREINAGVWEDKTFGEIVRHEGEKLLLFNNDPDSWMVEGSERFSSMRNRMYEAISGIARENEGKTVAIFSHGGAIRAFLSTVLEIASDKINEIMHSDNTAVTLLNFSEGKFEVVYANDNSHLSSDISTLGRQKWWKNSVTAVDMNIWFAPVGDSTDRYIEFRKDAWQTVYGNLDTFDGESFLHDAKIGAKDRPEALVYAMVGDEVAGMLQLNFEKNSGYKAGYIPFFYLSEEYRNQGMGVQLLGHAVSHFRKEGRENLHLSVAPENEKAIRFYERYGFKRMGLKRSENDGLYLMEKRIELP